MNKNLTALMLVAVMSYSQAAAAAPVDAEGVSLAQGRMLSRVKSDLEEYAKRIRVDPSVLTFCYGELHFRTYQHPLNNHLPFGIVYNDIRDTDRLEQVLRARETYEHWFLRLCIANAKLTLERAAK